MSRSGQTEAEGNRQSGAGVHDPLAQPRGATPDSPGWTAEEFDVLRCAYIYANYETLTQREVADYLGVSAPTIARRLKEARERGWLLESRAYRPPPHARDMSRYFGDPELQYALASLLASHDVHGRLQRVEVVPLAEDWEQSRDRCANVAARQLEEALRSGKHVLACNWGQTTEAIARALRPATENEELKVVPIFGDLGVNPEDEQFTEAHRYYANQVAGLIAERFGASVPVRLPFKAFIPTSYEDPELGVIKGYLSNDISYQLVFGEKRSQDEPAGYIHRAGTLISGVGALEERNAWFKYTQRVATPAEPPMEPQDLKPMEEAGIVGDIAQHFVTIDGVDAGLPAGLEKVAAMNERVVGLEPKHFQEVARRHVEDKVPGLGVLIVAGGSNKAAVTLAAVRSGAVNHLIVDQELAAAVLALEE